MSEITVSAKNFHRLSDYLHRVGLDAVAIAGDAGLSADLLAQLSEEQALPAQQYSRYYRAAVKRMQALGEPLPWAAGLGSEAFELMCHTLITGRDLGEALTIASRFEKLVYPLVGYNIKLLHSAGQPARLSYRIEVSPEDSRLIPGDWDRYESGLTVARASGLLIWQALCGWLTGQALETRALVLSGPYVSDLYQRRLEQVFSCPISYDQDENYIEFDERVLRRRVVQTADSLKTFLGNCVYELIAIDQQPASTSAAIRSLVGIDLVGGMPSITEMADTLHMSESSLRRRLRSENTSYQALKDEVRCEVAVDKLLNENAKVADIAEYLGFAEPSSFVRSFKSWTGQTPSDYRETMRSLGAA